MKRILSFVCILAAAVSCSRTASKVSKRDIFIEKNYYLCSEIGKDAPAADLLCSDEALSALSRAKYDSVRAASSADEAIRASLLTGAEIDLVAARLSALCSDGALKRLTGKIRETGKYCIYDELPDGEFLSSAWRQDAEGINHVINVYAFGEKPVYPSIDSIDFTQDNELFAIAKQTARENVLAFCRKDLFYSLPMETAYAFLDINYRFECTDYEPLEEGLNKAAYAAAGKTDWKRYPYSAILVLGWGSGIEGEEITPQSRQNCQYAAMLYHKGKAPFIIVSGGRVHPFKTKFSEAWQMRQYLIETLGIPEKAIMAEPHARHTTTNVRNAVRIMLSRGFPQDKPFLVTSFSTHLDYILKDTYKRRSMDLCKIMPCRIGEKTSDRTLELYPLPCSTQISPIDPLDP